MSRILVLESCSSCGKVVRTNVVTQHNDNFGTGAYLLKTRLMPANVSTDFGLLYPRNVEGGIYSQPRFVHGVKTTRGKKNLFFIATGTNMAYAFDADDRSAGASPVFNRRLQPTGPSSVCGETPPAVAGITGTPVIDPGVHAMYVVARNSNDQRHLLAQAGHSQQL